VRTRVLKWLTNHPTTIPVRLSETSPLLHNQWRMHPWIGQLPRFGNASHGSDVAGAVHSVEDYHEARSIIVNKLHIRLTTECSGKKSSGVFPMSDGLFDSSPSSSSSGASSVFSSLNSETKPSGTSGKHGTVASIYSQSTAERLPH
jgi:hypothetical protein